MNKKQSNRFNAFMAIKGVLNKHPTIITSLPMLNQTVDEFFALINEINEVGIRREKDTTGETAAKRVAKNRLASLASRLAASGMACAFDRSDKEMETALDYSYYEIRSAKDADTLQMTGAIETELLKHREELDGYMVTGVHLADLPRHMEQFREAMRIKGGVKSARVADTRELSRLFKTTGDLLSRKMDRLILRLKTESPTFTMPITTPE